MTSLLDLVGRHLDEPARARHRFSTEMSWLLVTPRFRASRHVIALLVPPGERRPSLVAKLARLPGDDAALAREAETLRALHVARPGFEGAPEAVAFARKPVPMLVETALSGEPLTPAAVRARLADALPAARTWLLSLPAVAGPANGWFDELVAAPLERFAEHSPARSERTRLVELSLDALRPLRRSSVPLVLEHGDFCHPNILWSEQGLGAVDWELARPEGLPLQDHCFFLAYAAAALARARSADEHVAAFRRAFFRSGWAREELRASAEALGLADDAVPKLLVACFARYTARLAERVDGEARGDWVEENRYYALWREALWRHEELERA